MFLQFLITESQLLLLFTLFTYTLFSYIVVYTIQLYCSIYIYIYRERERERDLYVHEPIYTYIILLVP